MRCWWTIDALFGPWHLDLDLDQDLDLDLDADLVWMQVKSYPRQWWCRGRIRVQLKNSDGSLVNPDVPNRVHRPPLPMPRPGLLALPAASRV